MKIVFIAFLVLLLILGVAFSCVGVEYGRPLVQGIGGVTVVISATGLGLGPIVFQYMDNEEDEDE